MSEKFDPIEHAKLIYQARPDAFTSAAYQTVLKLDWLKERLEKSMEETKLLWEAAQETYKEAQAEKAKYTWQPEDTAPYDRYILILDEQGDTEVGIKASSDQSWGIKWIDGGLPLDWKPTHWMELPASMEPPDENIPDL